jgi:hypothetical protein
MKRDDYCVYLATGRPSIVDDLERLALDAHRRGDNWYLFWRDHWKPICKAARSSRRRRPMCAMIDRLKTIVETGESRLFHPGPELLSKSPENQRPENRPLQILLQNRDSDPQAIPQTEGV